MKKKNHQNASKQKNSTTGKKSDSLRSIICGYHV